MFVTAYGSSVRFRQDLPCEMQQHVEYGTFFTVAYLQYGVVGSMHPYIVQMFVGTVRLVERENPVIVRVAQAQIFPVYFFIRKAAFTPFPEYLLRALLQEQQFERLSQILHTLMPLSGYLSCLLPRAVLHGSFWSRILQKHD